MEEPLRAWLRQCDALKGISDAAIEDLIKFHELVELPSGTVVIEQGGSSEHLYLIKEGSCEVFKQSNTGREPVAKLHEGALFGERGLIQNTKRTATVATTTDCQLLKFDANEFDHMFGEHKAFAGLLSKQVASYAQMARPLHQGTFSEEAEQVCRANYVYPIVLLSLILAWVSYMTISNNWALMLQHWQQALTMVLGSFVAGSTPAGGGAVAFPVFTKLLGIETSIARDHSLLIQSVGMTMASIFIFSRKIPIYTNALLWALPMGALGFLIGSVLDFNGALGNLNSKAIFSSILLAFVGAFLIHKIVLKRTPIWNPTHLNTSQRLVLMSTGFIGGSVVSIAGSGIDLICFITMVIGFSLDERRVIPTTVVAMAALSIIGSIIRVSSDHAIDPITIEYWVVCIPIVAIGAPMGALVASMVTRTTLVRGVFILIFIDLLSTLIQLATQPESTIKNWMVFLLSLAIAGAVLFGLMRMSDKSKVKPNA